MGRRKSQPEREKVVLYKSSSLLVDDFGTSSLVDLAAQLQGWIDETPEKYRDSLMIRTESWEEYYEGNWCYSTEVYYMKVKE